MSTKRGRAPLTRGWRVRTTKAVVVGSTTRCSRYQLVEGILRVSSVGNRTQVQHDEIQVPVAQDQVGGLDRLGRRLAADPQEPGQRRLGYPGEVKGVPTVDQGEQALATERGAHESGQQQPAARRAHHLGHAAEGQTAL